MSDLSEKENFDFALVVLWKFCTGVMVFFMQAGFALLEAGSIQRKNIKNVLTKNTIDVCVAGTAFWACGYAFAFGCTDKENCTGFIGSSNFGLRDFNNNTTSPGFILWFYQFAFVSCAATIVTHCVAERVRFWVFPLHTLFLAGFVYPVVAHWVWGGGWLERSGVIDISGGIVVHVVGGMAGLVGAIFAGPRFGRFEGPRFSVTVHEFQSFSPPFCALGLMILWFGWYGFNCGSIPLTEASSKVIELIAINTTLAPSGAILTAIAVNGYPKFENVHFAVLFNCGLAGLVSITPASAVVEPSIAFGIGAIGALVYMCSSKLLHQLKIDDPVDSSPVHLFCGTWGSLAVGLFAKPDYVQMAYMSSPNKSLYQNYGLIYDNHSGSLLLWQFISLVCVMVWVAVLTCSIFAVFAYFKLLRISIKSEMVGLDHVMHDGLEHRSVPLSLVVTNEQDTLVDRLVALASV
eukprot:c11021_g1_i1.p1 GENE.c11021_g1_i1~~c11021_g1_i1.p1  ORF type:complete len:462 (-),score=101.18 c11021_g1_i1:264-1649(-)